MFGNWLGNRLTNYGLLIGVILMMFFGNIGQFLWDNQGSILVILIAVGLISWICGRTDL